ncbi:MULTISPECIES: sulfotransferase-like domain-containing protein [Micromonospora]|uniref:Sulfotransferase family protein n=1 Tax=Micromonospora yangpuensis TaxID=683228 RepID=A0A1C6VH57_9ACTN|nr:hypothetical protein [Micromonospora yangpuensis]GGL99427.1 branched chain amino acid aminotransferase [Micromonospora yangpuensis]SCL65622.1 Sulfotransferase family protein [Micromonospora yangpuensis]
MTAPIVALWSAPRSRSTAFYRSMVARGDLRTVHEPFCGVTDFGQVTIGTVTAADHRQVIGALRALGDDGPVFFKDTTDYRYPAVLADRDFLATARHTFVIRRPEEIIPSYYALRPDMRLSDVGIEHMHELFEAVRAAGGHEPVVLDSDDLVDRPTATMAAYCAAVGLPFDPAALSWPEGALPDWERTGRWHVEVNGSRGFVRRPAAYAETTENNPLLARYRDHHQPFYVALRRHRLTPAAG